MPTYTIDQCTGGIPFANCINNNAESQAELVDNNLGTKWLTLNPTFTISNLFVRNQLVGGAATVVSYSFTTAEDHPERDLNGWILEGSNNGTTWTTLDTQTELSWLSRFQVRIFNFSNATAYAYYRFNFTHLAGASGNAGSDASSHVAEIKLYTGANATGTEVGQGGTATASNAAINAASNAFDNNNYTKWEAAGSSWTLGSPVGWWFGYNFASSKAIAQYTITSGNDADERDPQDWLFQYSDDGVTWTTADTQTGQDFTGRGQTKTYQFTSPGAHLYWRFFCTRRGDSSTGGLMQVGEMEMMEEVGGGGGASKRPKAYQLNNAVRRATYW